jgi:surfeit locus 1 family protein
MITIKRAAKLSKRSSIARSCACYSASRAQSVSPTTTLSAVLAEELDTFSSMKQIVNARARASSGKSESREASNKDYFVYTFPSIVCACLGYWQLNRREEKILKIKNRTEQLLKEPLLDVSEILEDTEEFRRVVVKGEIDRTSGTVFVGPKVRTSPVSNNEKIVGSDVVSAIVSESESGWSMKSLRGRETNGRKKKAIVNRGFARKGWEEAKGGVCLKTVGVVRKGDQSGFFTPSNVPEKGVWHFVDIDAIAEYLGMKEKNVENEQVFVPYVQLIRPTESSPSSYDYNDNNENGQPTPVAEEDLMKFAVLPDQHLGYSATWFSLSAVTLGLGAYALKQKRMPKNVL